MGRDDTDNRELTEEELYANRELGDDYDRKYPKMSMIKVDANGSFRALKDAVFFALILGMGLTVWAQQQTNSSFREQIAVLKIECKNNTQQRGQ